MAISGLLKLLNNLSNYHSYDTWNNKHILSFKKINPWINLLTLIKDRFLGKSLQQYNVFMWYFMVLLSVICCMCQLSSRTHSLLPLHSNVKINEQYTKNRKCFFFNWLYWLFRQLNPHCHHYEWRKSLHKTSSTVPHTLTNKPPT